MASPIDTERQKLLLQQEIAKLSGRLNSYMQFPANKVASFEGSYQKVLHCGAGGDNMTIQIGAISRHASVPSHSISYHPYSRGRPTTRSQSASRGRGRARGGYTYGLNLRVSDKTASISPLEPSSSVPHTSQAFGPEDKEAGEISPTATPADEEQLAKGKAIDMSWIKKTSKGGHMSLMTVQKRQVEMDQIHQI